MTNYLYLYTGLSRRFTRTGVVRFQTKLRTVADQMCNVPKTSVIRPDILSQALPLPSSAFCPAKADM
jgi:hypothetical protein